LDAANDIELPYIIGPGYHSTRGNDRSSEDVFDLERRWYEAKADSLHGRSSRERKWQVWLPNPTGAKAPFAYRTAYEAEYVRQLLIDWLLRSELPYIVGPGYLAPSRDRSWEQGVADFGAGATVPPRWQIWLPEYHVDHDGHRLSGRKAIFHYGSPEEAEHVRQLLIDWFLRESQRGEGLNEEL
jgi:hypothetical protein